MLEFDNINEVKQLEPNHADHMSRYNTQWLVNMLDNEPVVVQPKYDGERMLIHIIHGQVFCTSRRFSKKTNRYMENQDKLPALAEVCKNIDIDYTVLDCECYAKDWSTVVGILHSLPDRAILLQQQDAVKFAVFDCLMYKGKDIRSKPYYYRLKCAYDIVNIINYPLLHFVKFMNNHHHADDVEHMMLVTTLDNCQQCMLNAIDSGFEGVVVKSLLKSYYDKGASLKCKKFETVDVVVIGYKPGTGKYTHTIGALKVGYFDKESNSFIHISNVNCSTDAERQLWFDKWDSLKYSVIEIKCQEITNNSLRHPVYIRRRADKDYTMCTKCTIFK